MPPSHASDRRPAPPSRFSREAARTFYNAADALLPPAPGAVAIDWMPAVEACVARRGEAVARRLSALLARLERAPVGWRSHRTFSRLAREERAAWLARWAADPRRGADHALLLELLAAAGAEAQSESGA